MERSRRFSEQFARRRYVTSQPDGEKANESVTIMGVGHGTCGFMGFDMPCISDGSIWIAASCITIGPETVCQYQRSTLMILLVFRHSHICHWSKLGNSTREQLAPRDKCGSRMPNRLPVRRLQQIEIRKALRQVFIQTARIGEGASCTGARTSSLRVTE